MNRDNRNTMARNTRMFCQDIQKCCCSYSDFLERMKQGEDDKLDKMQGSLAETETAEQISEASDMIGQAMDIVSQIDDTLDELSDVLSVPRNSGKVIRGGKTLTYLDPVSDPKYIENRTKRLQFVVTPELADSLKKASADSGISMNEIICRILYRNVVQTP